jgi:hypothetical protein
VPARIENTGDFETICVSDDLSLGAAVKLIFKAWDDVSPPFTVKVRSPDGKIILDRVLRDLPTGRPQSAPPVAFNIVGPGQYKLEISELYGAKAGKATIHVP